MKCPECEKAGQRSRVNEGPWMTTAMGGESFYDEDGRYHRHDPNSSWTTMRCSNGHSWQHTVNPKCPVDGCSWNRPA